MVKMSETIICQRFIQNAWKKDLCSNCFKSKEDHVALPEKKITYTWTSHVNNYPQHGILRDREKNGKEKLRSVSFLTNETEVIGFGGEEYSSDDEFYPTQRDDCAVETDNEEEDREFRRLTRCNTDFNSIPANLKSDKIAPDIRVQNAYSDLKLGKPLVDADGRRKTLQVSVEPFKNSVFLNGTVANDRKIHLNKILLDSCPSIKKTDNKSDSDKSDITKNENSDNNGINSHINNAKSNTSDSSFNNYYSNVNGSTVTNNKSDSDVNNNPDNNCEDSKHIILSEPLPIYDITSTATTDNNVNILNVNLNETANDVNVSMKCTPQKEVAVADDGKYLRISNILVNVTKSDDTKFDTPAKMDDNIIKAKMKCENGNEKPKLSIHQPAENKSNLIKEKRSCSMNKDCNPINLPLILSKELDIEYDKPGSREMVGEPDGKADSDDSSDPLHSTDDSGNAKPTPVESPVYMNPQISFLHGINKDKPVPAAKPVALAMTNNSSKKSPAVKELSETTNTAPSTPKLQIPINSCNGTGSTKRQAPKPPSPKMTPSTPTLTAPVLIETFQTPTSTFNGFCENSPMIYDSPLVNGMRDAINFLGGDHNTSNIKRPLNTDYVTYSNYNSLNVCIPTTPSSTNSLKRFTISNDLNESKNMNKDVDTTSITSIESENNIRSATKCSRSLSCDSIISPNVLSEKSRKYNAATIKVKSKIRKFLRFNNNKEDEKVENEAHIPVVPRRRIEIIHPLDLNKSSIEILRTTNSTNVPNGECDSGKKTENEIDDVKKLSPALNVNNSTSPAARPTKPPPPPRAQSLDQRFSEISRPVRPPPPKSGNSKLLQPSKCNTMKASSNLYENIGESRHGIAPAKPQRASSMRDRTRQNATFSNAGENMTSLASECEAVPECDQNQQQLSDSCESPPVSSITYCGSETESEICFRLLASRDSNCSKNDTLDGVKLSDSKQIRKDKSVMHSSLEDNYGAVVIANHDALSQLLERVNQATLVPNSLKILQTTLHFQFNHLTLVESSRIIVADWHFYNASWTNRNVVVSISAKHLAPMRSLPSYITLYPLVKFTDLIPATVLKADSLNDEKINAHITIWNEEQIESLSHYCKKLENTATFNECGLLLAQLTNALKHLHASGFEDISLDEIFVCKRESDVESKLLLLPFNVECITSALKNDSRNSMLLCKCVSAVLDMLLPNQRITEIINRILNEERSTSLSQAKAVAEYWLWGPGDVSLTDDRQTSLQRWLDLERANYLQKMVCKQPSEICLHERCHMTFLVHTDAKTLTEASCILERST